jgi:DNA-binding SARP family transcriptional activator
MPDKVIPRILKADYLGGFKLEHQSDQPLHRVALTLSPTVKSQSLLAFLIFQREQTHSRERLMNMFWGDFSSRRARRSLSTALWHIRRCFPNHDPIQGNSQSVQFAFNGDINLDVDEFEKRINRGVLLDLQDAIILYKGDFLDGFYDDWVINERYRLQSLFIKALAKLMTLHERAGDHNDALYTAQELLKFDSLREDAHRLLMRTYCAMGQRNTALEQYRSCQKVLKDDLGVDPTPETSSLFQDIQSGNYEIGQNAPIVAIPTNRAIPTARSPLDIATPQVLVGREKELSLLDDQWDGQSNLVLVAGEVGIGKTCFLETFAKNLSNQGTRVLWGRCYEFEHLLPYQPIAEALGPSLAGLTTEVTAMGHQRVREVHPRCAGRATQI